MIQQRRATIERSVIVSAASAMRRRREERARVGTWRLRLVKQANAERVSERQAAAMGARQLIIHCGCSLLFSLWAAVRALPKRLSRAVLLGSRRGTVRRRKDELQRRCSGATRESVCASCGVAFDTQAANMHHCSPRVSTLGIVGFGQRRDHKKQSARGSKRSSGFRAGEPAD